MFKLNLKVLGVMVLLSVGASNSAQAFDKTLIAPAIVSTVGAAVLGGATYGVGYLAGAVGTIKTVTTVMAALAGAIPGLFVMHGN